MASFLGELHVGVEQPVAAEIFLDKQGLRAVSISGQTHRTRYADLVVDVEPSDSSVIARSARDEVAVSSTQSGFLEALRRAGVRIDDHVLDSMAQGHGRRRGLKWLFAILGGSLAMILLVIALPFI